MLKAIIFDMDGVLLDSERLWPEIEFERYRKLIPAWTMDNHKLLTGLSLNDSYKMFTEKFGLDMSWEEYDGFYRTMAREVYLEKTSFYPGAEEMLQELKAAGVPIGLATSSPTYWLDLIYERFPLNEYFSVLLGADDVDGKGKPAPDLYLMACEKLGFPPEECIAIEDSSNGVLAAHDAGMFPIGFRNGHNDETDFSLATLTVHGFTGENRETLIDMVTNGTGTWQSKYDDDHDEEGESLAKTDIHHLDRGVTVTKTTGAHKEGLFAISAKIWDGEDYIPTVWDEWISDEGFYTILLDDRVVGCMKYTVQPRYEILLEGLRMDPDLEGKGYASIAVDFFMRLVDSLRPGLLRFATSDENVFSHHFGNKYGFGKVASFFHRFMVDDEIRNKVDELHRGRIDLFPIVSGTGAGPWHDVDGGTVTRTSVMDFGRTMVFLQSSPEWKPAHNLLSRGWVFHPYSDASLLSLLGSDFSFIRENEDGQMVGIILADHSRQYPTDIDITWLSGDPESVRLLLSRLFLEADVETVHEIAAKIPTPAIAEIAEEFGLHRHPRVDGSHVFEKKYQ